MSVSAGYPVEGESIGPYRIVRRIAAGGMGVVYEAEDTTLNRRVALKVISPHLAEDDEFRARFTREAQAQASLDSAHVVHVYAHGVGDGRLYIAAQLIPDGDLGQMIQAYGAPPVRVALDVMAQVADGLADAHAVGLIHRDIKPANVLLRRRENSVTAYLSDFGIARQVSVDQTQSRTGTIGTPSYMAPELHTGGKARVESDIYSLGCLLWATVTGRAPYTGTSEYQIVSAHVEQPVPQLPEDGPLATEVNRVLRMAMAKDPAGRYSSAADLRDDLRNARTLPDGATPVDRTPATPDGRSRKPVGVLVIGVLILVALIAGGVSYALLSGDGEEPSADPTSTPSATRSEPSEPTDPSDPSDPETSGSSAPAPTGSDEEVAIANVARAFEDAGTMNEAQAQCAAEQWVRTAGLQPMIDAGLFDDDLNFTDRDMSEMPPEIASAISAAALTCAAASPSS